MDVSTDGAGTVFFLPFPRLPGPPFLVRFGCEAVGAGAAWTGAKVASGVGASTESA